MDSAALRREAATRLNERAPISQPQTEADLRQLQHDLEIRQIELEIQNEELHVAQAEVERRADFFDVAPVGYFEWSADGTIQHLNLTAASLVGMDRDKLLGRSFGMLVAKIDQESFNAFLTSVFSTAQKQTCELTLATEGRPPLYTRVEAVLCPNGKECRAVLIDITERKLAEAQLRSSLNEVNDLKAALDEHAIVAITDAQGRITFVNDKFCAISKYSRDELLGQDHRIINSGFHPTEFIRDLWTTITHGKVWHGEIKNRAKDGTFYWVDTTIVPFLNAQGKPRQYVAIRADITERKRAEQAFRDSEELFLKAFRLSPDCVVIVRMSDRTVIRANDALCQLWGSTPEEVIGKPSLEYSTWQTEEEQHAFMRTLEEKGAYLNYETILRMTDGRLLNFNISSRMINFNEESCVLSVMRDITEHKRAEESMRLQANLLDQSYDAILVWEIGGAIRLWNRGAAALYGYSKEEAVGCVSHDLLRTSHTQSVDILIEALIRDGKWEGELRHTAKDGHQVTIETRMVIVSEHNRRLVLEANRDITERKRAEEAIRNLNSELEHRVVERTAQLESANKELEAFSYSVSHDLRAPLRAVDGFSRAVLEDYGDQLPEDGKDSLQCIRNGAQQMGHLIDDLLSFSRLSRAPLTNLDVDVERMVRAILEDLKVQQLGRQIDIQVADLSPCHGDSALLKQVWINLLSNAIKYTGKREKAVVKVGCTKKDGETIYFVRDNGTGFDMRYAGKLFGVFQRLHRTEDYEGTGVGLAIVHRIITRHGGRIWADAAVDRGACFYFTLEERLQR